MVLRGVQKMTVKRVIYIIFLLLAGLFSILYNVYFTMILFFAVLILPAFLLLLAWISLKKVEVKVLAEHALTEKNKDVEVRFDITNRSKLPIPRLEICYTYCNEISGTVKRAGVELSVDGYSTAYTTLNLKSEHCGNIRITVLRLRCYDFISVGRAIRKVSSSATISVMPSIHPMAGDIIRKTADMEMQEESIHYLEHKPGNDPSEIFGVRDYKDGDRPSQIHWKLSRKNHRLIMKEYSQPLRDQAILYLAFQNGDKGEKKLMQTDCYLEAILSVSEGILEKGHQHSLVWYDRKEKRYLETDITDSDSSKAAQMTFLSASFCKEKEDIAADYELPEENGSNIIYITNILIEEEILKWHKSGRRYLYIIYVNDLQKEPIGTAMEEFLHQSLISYYLIDTSKIKETIFRLGI